MQVVFRWLAGLCCLLVAGCGVVRDTPKYGFTDGYYAAHVPGKGRTHFYVNHTEDSISLYRVKDRQGKVLEPAGTISINGSGADTVLPARNFRQVSFDLDFLTIPFKYRPPQADVPRQFNTHLNGAVYLGYRTDIYGLDNRRDPLGRYKQRLNHFGFSGGVFTGLGGTAMNPSVTSPAIDKEYDGFIWSKGIAGIIGFNNITAGLTLGWDHLLDPNRKAWINQGKLWLGLAFGLNLN